MFSINKIQASKRKSARMSHLKLEHGYYFLWANWDAYSHSLLDEEIQETTQVPERSRG
jgi:hypothetical protein